MISWSRRWPALAVAFVTAFAFQNCLGPTELETTGGPARELAARTPGGNGEGYDGKLYNLTLADGACADGDPVAARILVKDGAGTMIRRDCRDLGEGERFAVPLVFTDADQRILVYEGDEYLLQYVQFAELARAADASLVAGGTVYNTGRGHLPALTNLGAAGRPQWSLTYDHDFTGRTLSFAALTPVTDGLLVSASAIDLDPATAFGSREPALIARLDTLGRPRWARAYGEDLPARHKLRFHRALELGSGRLLVGASLIVFAEGADLHNALRERAAGGLVWLDGDGRVSAERWFEDFVLTDLQPAGDGGGYLLIGARAGRGLVLKVDATGVPVWARELEMNLQSALALADGGVAVAGLQELGSSTRTRAVIARLDGDGGLMWSRAYGRDDDVGMAGVGTLVARPQGGFYAVGFADRAGGGGRVATYLSVGADGALADNAQLKPGFAARWKAAALLGPDALWASLVDSDFRRVENSLNEVLVRLNPRQDPVCAGCVRNDGVRAADAGLGVASPAPVPAAPLLGGFVDRELRARSLGYPIFVSP